MLRSPLLLGTHSTDERLLHMGVTRIAVGLVGAAPGVGARVFGTPSDQITPVARLLARLFGIRNVLLGAWALASRGAGAEEQRRCAQLNLCVDVADLAVIAPALLRKDLRRTAAMSAVLAVSATLGWLEILDGL